MMQTELINLSITSNNTSEEDIISNIATLITKSSNKSLSSLLIQLKASKVILSTIGWQLVSPLLQTINESYNNIIQDESSDKERIEIIFNFLFNDLLIEINSKEYLLALFESKSVINEDLLDLVVSLLIFKLFPILKCHMNNKILPKFIESIFTFITSNIVTYNNIYSIVDNNNNSFILYFYYYIYLQSSFINDSILLISGDNTSLNFYNFFLFVTSLITNIMALYNTTTLSANTNNFKQLFYSHLELSNEFNSKYICVLDLSHLPLRVCFNNNDSDIANEIFMTTLTFLFNCLYKQLSMDLSKFVCLILSNKGTLHLDDIYLKGISCYFYLLSSLPYNEKEIWNSVAAINNISLQSFSDFLFPCVLSLVKQSEYCNNTNLFIEIALFLINSIPFPMKSVILLLNTYSEWHEIKDIKFFIDKCFINNSKYMDKTKKLQFYFECITNNTSLPVSLVLIDILKLDKDIEAFISKPDLFNLFYSCFEKACNFESFESFFNYSNLLYALLNLLRYLILCFNKNIDNILNLKKEKLFSILTKLLNICSCHISELKSINNSFFPNEMFLLFDLLSRDVELLKE